MTDNPMSATLSDLDKQIKKAEDAIIAHLREMSATPEAPRIEKLEAAIRALAASVSAEPAAHINHEAEVSAILDAAAAPDTGIRVEREEIRELYDSSVRYDVYEFRTYALSMCRRWLSGESR